NRVIHTMKKYHPIAGDHISIDSFMSEKQHSLNVGKHLKDKLFGLTSAKAKFLHFLPFLSHSNQISNSPINHRIPYSVMSNAGQTLYFPYPHRLRHLQSRI